MRGAKMGAVIGRHRGASQVRKLVHLAERKNAAEYVETATLITLPRSGPLQPFNDAHVRVAILILPAEPSGPSPRVLLSGGWRRRDGSRS
jgi:hypothetical protein